MLRKFVWAFLVISGVVLSGAAWAITATVTGQGTGQAEKGGSLTLVVHSQSGKSHTYSGKINPTTHRATVPVVVKKGDTVYASLDGGLTGKPVTEKEINEGIPINFSYGVGPIPPPSTYTGTPPTGYTPGYSSVPYTWTGFYIGGQGSFSSFDQRITERPAGTDMVSNRLVDTRGMGNVGINAGYDFGGLGVPGLTIGPTGSFNYVGQSNNHEFSGGFFLGTRTNWTADLGGRVGYWGPDRLMSIYAVGGLELVNYDLQSNFTGPVLAVNRTATGAFIGAGVEFTRPEWRMGNGQWTAFGQATYSWICGDTVHMPVFSPAFDYSTRSDQIRVSLGGNYRFGGQWP
jgi:hypothetical protein